MMIRTVAVALALGAALAALQGWLPQTLATGDSVITVTRTDDPPPDGCDVNGCSLREAVTAASAASGDETLVLPGTTVTLTLGPIDLPGEITLTGDGPGVSVVDAAGGRAFQALAGADVGMEGITVRNAGGSGCGAAFANAGELELRNVDLRESAIEGQGGGICNTGTATLDGATVAGNRAVSNDAGGGIWNSGEMTVRNSTISENMAVGVNAGGDGAGIYNSGGLTIETSVISENEGTSPACDDCSSGAGITNDGTVVIRRSSISGNHADNAAGISNSGIATIERSTIAHNDAGSVTTSSTGSMTIFTSTVSNNLPAAYPKQLFGGVASYGDTLIQASTISGNTSTGVQYGGIFNGTNGATTLRSTILAGNGARNCHSGGTIATQGWNLADDDTCRLTAGSDHVVDDANIGPLEDNGGPTLTHALLNDSAAIDHGSGLQCTQDQRGAPRPAGSGCDVGAFEYGAVPPTPSPSPSPTPVPVAFPMGDADCDEAIGTSDVMEELRLAARLSEPATCGRDTLPCFEFADDCYPVWVDTDCNEIVDGRDVMMIVLHMSGNEAPTPPGCTAVGEMPNG